MRRDEVMRSGKGDATLNWTTGKLGPTVIWKKRNISDEVQRYMERARLS